MPSTLGIISSHINYVPPSFTIVPNRTTINEGETVTFTINATNFNGSGTIYWTNAGTAVGSTDFNPSNVTNGGTLTLTRTSNIICFSNRR